MIYSIPATWEQMDGDEQIGEVEMVIHFNVTPSGGDGWNEPRYAAQAEFHHVEYPAVEIETAAKIENWAQDWLEKHQDTALAVYHDAMQREAEYAAELRSER